MNIQLRRKVMKSKDDRIIYMARNLVCDGNTWFDTGFAPFSQDNIDKDFKITIRLSSFSITSGSGSQDVVLGGKYQGTLNSLSYPGLYFRLCNTNTSLFQVGGYNYYQPSISSVLNKNLYIWRENGTFYAQIQGQASKTTLSVRSTVFNQHIILGAGQQTNGTKFRYSTCTIDYIRIEYMNIEEDLDPDNPWKMLVHNNFDTYSYTKANDGSTFSVAQDGESVEIISNGQNKNTSVFYFKPRFEYANIKNKECRITWDIECSNPALLTTQDGAANITFGLYSTQEGNLSGRVSKYDFITLAQGNLLGTHSEVFVPSELMAGLTESTYFGWNIGFRSAIDGLSITIKQLDFEVEK